MTKKELVNLIIMCLCTELAARLVEWGRGYLGFSSSSNNKGFIQTLNGGLL